MQPDPTQSHPTRLFPHPIPIRTEQLSGKNEKDFQESKKPRTLASQNKKRQRWKRKNKSPLLPSSF